MDVVNTFIAEFRFETGIRIFIPESEQHPNRMKKVMICDSGTGRTTKSNKPTLIRTGFFHLSPLSTQNQSLD